MFFCWLIYRGLFGPYAEVFPELGMARPFVYGNTVLGEQATEDGLRIRFVATPQGSGLGGGIIYNNVPIAVQRIFLGWSSSWPLDDTIVRDGTHVHLLVRGKHGGERFELKLKNKGGEGWCVVGGEKYPITSEFHEIQIPLSEFEDRSHTALGAAFSRVDGLSTVVFAVGEQLNNSEQTEIHVASLKITKQTRRDWLMFFLLIPFPLFIVSSGLWGFSVYHTHFSVFISYSRKDAKIVEELGQQLRDRGIDPWLDTRNIKIGETFNSIIARGVRKSQYFALIASRHSDDSQYVGVEIGYRVNQRGSWLRRQWKGEIDTDEIIPISIRIIEGGKKEEKEDKGIPSFLANLNRITFNIKLELLTSDQPIPADVRQEISGAAEKIAKIIFRGQKKPLIR